MEAVEVVVAEVEVEVVVAEVEVEVVVAEVRTMKVLFLATGEAGMAVAVQPVQRALFQPILATRLQRNLMKMDFHHHHSLQNLVPRPVPEIYTANATSIHLEKDVFPFCSR